MKLAMRSKEQARLTTIRLLQAAIQRREVDERITLDDAQIVAVAEKLIKQSRDAIGQYTKAGRDDLIAKEKSDIAVWEQYLPAQMDAAEVEQLITSAIADAGADSVKDMGKVMAIIKPKLQGRADMGKVSAQVKAKLNSGN